jgi:hypothetical protein
MRTCATLVCLFIAFSGIAGFGASRADAVIVENIEAGIYCDVHASPEAAMSSLAARIARSIQSTQGFVEDGSRRVIVVGALDEEIVQRMHAHFPQTCVTVGEPPTTQPAADEFLVRVRTLDFKRPGAIWGSTDLESGTLLALVFTPTKTKPTEITVKFVDKPWADDFGAFVNRDKGRQWMLAESPRPCISEAEANQQAIQAAALELWPAVKEQMRVNAIGKTKIMVSQQFVVDQVEQALSRGVGVADRFVQKFDRPYGPVWKQSLLIDASRTTLDKYAKEISAVARAERAQQVGTWRSTGALVVVILLLYFFVNAVTKGYFVWRLRAVALLAAIVGILAVMATR